ncbi:2872_t:CDS:2 [Funneliformis geosporum]|uniref:13141_t:CDS:1 n=1 Tax=Funneliformis geosporum TaxID=1117311 RepID=A0A9W4STL2_9GLOM|nr:2872_t:CDS:2 [Funneliformis geosporum]CAI2180158.1 13141_t:CDS:2 [Funneliformis geosporum]
MSLNWRQYLAIIFAAGVFGAIAISFISVSLPKIEVEPDRLTGYPTWHGAFKGYDSLKNDSMLTFVGAIMFVVSVIGLKLVLNPPTKPSQFYTGDDNQETISGVPTIGFNRLIVIYMLATFMSAVALIFFDIGKLFAVIAVSHNALEIAMLLLIGGGGRIKGVSFFVWLVIYVESVALIYIFNDFPIDALVFKVQGLTFDFALVIEFVRIYITTINHLRDAGKVKIPSNSEEIVDNDKTRKSLSAIFNQHPKQLIFLILASIIHVFGNLWSTIFITSAIANLIFGASYAIAFPIYILYLYVDIRASSVISQKRIYLPSTPAWKAIVIAIYSLSLALLTIRLGFIILAE